MRAFLLVCLIGSAVIAAGRANGEVVRCEGADGRQVYREARDCPQARKSGTALNVGPQTVLRSTVPSLAVPAPYQTETPPQYTARVKVYCASLPPAERSECQVQGKAQTELFSANYYAARKQEDVRRLGETPAQYAGRWAVYCVSQPPAQRSECQVQAKAQTELFSANYYAAAKANANAELHRLTQKYLKKILE